MELGSQSIGASEILKISEQAKPDIVEPYKVTANDGEKEPMPRELGTKEELLNVFLRKKHW
jgi:hypothetical protein